MSSTRREILCYARASSTSGLTARLYWVFSNALVKEGLHDSWWVRVDGEQQRGFFTLKQVAGIDSTSPDRLVEIKNAKCDQQEHEPNGTWTRVLPDDRFLRLCRPLLDSICALAGLGVGAYAFISNHGNWLARAACASAAAVICALLLRPSLRHLIRALCWACHLFFDHRSASLRGGVVGGVTGLILGPIFWDFSSGTFAGVLVTTLMMSSCALFCAAGFAQAEHERHTGQPTLLTRADSIRQPDTDKQLEQPTNSPKGQAGKSRALLAAVFITLLTAAIPAHDAGTGADASWSAALNYANEKKWQFGKDIVYTYGPLGFLATPYYSSHTVGLRMITKLALTLVVAAGVCLVAWRLRPTWRWLLIGAFVFFSGAINQAGSAYAAADLCIFLGLLAWGILCFLEVRRFGIVCCLCFVALAAFGTLVKVSLILPAATGVVAVAAGFYIRSSRKLSATTLLAYPVGLLVGWLATTQDPTHFGRFLRLGFEIARGYNDSMCYEIRRKATWGAVATAFFTFCALAVAFLRVRTTSRFTLDLSRLALLSWLCCLFFIVWKYGVVREAVFQLQVFIGFMPILALMLLTLTHELGSLHTWATGLALACLLSALLLLDAAHYRGHSAFCLCQPLRLLSWNMQILLAPTEYWKPDAVSVPLPKIRSIVGQSTVDVFGCEQACALINGLNYRPRPVFQTLAAYTAPLINLNEGFYLSKGAPEYVMFDLATGDRRFPPLEDSMVLRDLLVNYELVASEYHFLLLKSRAAETPKITICREGEVHFGERISLVNDGDANLWMEIEVKPTLAGRLVRLAYKPPPVGLYVWTGGQNDPDKYWAPPPMLSAGFLASPLLRERKDVQDLYTAMPITRPKAYSLELPTGTEDFWQKTFHYRIYKIENRLGPSSVP